MYIHIYIYTWDCDIYCERGISCTIHIHICDENMLYNTRHGLLKTQRPQTRRWKRPATKKSRRQRPRRGNLFYFGFVEDGRVVNPILGFPIYLTISLAWWFHYIITICLEVACFRGFTCTVLGPQHESINWITCFLVWE